MLILTRKPGETIMIGDTVEVVVLSSGRNPVRLGITAPPEISIHRQEIYEKIKYQHKSNLIVGEKEISEQEN